MLLFRQLSDPTPDWWEARAHWFVECYDPSRQRPYPIGLAFVTAFSNQSHIDFVFVVDEFRRLGIGTRLVRACERRWPGIMLSQPSDAISQAFCDAVRKPILYRPSLRSQCDE